MPSDGQFYTDRIARMRVLVADSFFDFRKVMRAMLIDEIGVYAVQEAKDGKQALAMLQKGQFDLVIAETTMEPVGGIELTALIREGSGGVDPKTPVIAVSGRPQLSDILAARDAGVDEYVAKPLSAKILQLRIHSIIDHPRPFVRGTDFFGPDRRRHGDEDFQGADRRSHKPHVVSRES